MMVSNCGSSAERRDGPLDRAAHLEVVDGGEVGLGPGDHGLQLVRVGDAVLHSRATFDRLHPLVADCAQPQRDALVAQPMVGGVEVDRAQDAGDGLADRQVLERRVGADTLQLLWSELELQLELLARNAAHSRAPSQLTKKHRPANAPRRRRYPPCPKERIVGNGRQAKEACTSAPSPCTGLAARLCQREAVVSMAYIVTSGAAIRRWPLIGGATPSPPTGPFCASLARGCPALSDPAAARAPASGRFVA